MRYAAIDKCECVNAQGWGITLYIQGCKRHCKGCFNPETWNLDGGTEFTGIEVEYIFHLLRENPYFTHIVIEGGEPFEKRNWKSLTKLLSIIKLYHPTIKVWIYTGYTYEELMYICNIDKYAEKWLLPILTSWVDILVDGPFIQEKKDITLAFRGSKNQRIIDMRKTQEQNKIVLYEKFI